MGPEVICLKQFYFFCRRHRRYVLIFLGMYYGCLFRWKETRSIRTAYCFVQMVDDILDGDRQFDSDIGLFVDSIIEELKTEKFAHANDASTLAAHFYQAISPRADATIIKKKLVELVETLKIDYERRVNCRSLPRSTLEIQHRRTFELSLDITLALVDSKTRTENCPGIVNSLIWCSVMRDLREDLSAGIINIPQEVLSPPGRALTAADIDSILNHQAVRQWIRSEFLRGQENLETAKESIERLNEESGKRIITIFWKSIKAYVPRYERQNLNILSPNYPPENTCE